MDCLKFFCNTVLSPSFVNPWQNKSVMRAKQIDRKIIRSRICGVVFSSFNHLTKEEHIFCGFYLYLKDKVILSTQRQKSTLSEDAGMKAEIVLKSFYWRSDLITNH